MGVLWVDSGNAKQVNYFEAQEDRRDMLMYFKFMMMMFFLRNQHFFVLHSTSNGLQKEITFKYTFLSFST